MDEGMVLESVKGMFKARERAKKGSGLAVCWYLSKGAASRFSHSSSSCRSESISDASLDQDCESGKGQSSEPSEPEDLAKKKRHGNGDGIGHALCA